jgi:hypothetical protein
MRSRSVTFVASAIALAAGSAAAPAAADYGPQDPADFPYVATIDCGPGKVEVGSGTRLFAPLVNMETGRRYWPVAWNVRAGKHKIKARKKHRRSPRTLRCHYNDGQAKGMVTIHRPNSGRPRPQDS